MRTLRSTVEYMAGDEILMCPQCGFEYVHLVKTKVATASYVITIDYNGYQVLNGLTQETKKAKNWRGARIIVEYHCENGCHGNIILQFRKGNTFVIHELLPSTLVCQDLWRD